MMDKVLKSVTVSNFRSIKGSITVPLDAPVVLIYGPNGAGKTSILTAIELALTGQTPSLARLDRNCASHLVHQDAPEGRVSIEVAQGQEHAASAEVCVSSTGVSGGGMLPKDEARFYSERCYLAQSTLCRLLEIYEGADTRRSDSPLTRFVKDLLGLDHLDALVEGLHDAGDVRRLRSALPAYWDVRDEVPVLQSRIQGEKTDLQELDEEIRAVTGRLLSRASDLGIEATLQTPTDQLRLELEGEPEEPELVRLARMRREIVDARQQWESVRSSVHVADLESAERAGARALDALETWKRSEGEAIEVLFERFGELLPECPSPRMVSPEVSRREALEAVHAEFSRCVAVLDRHADEAARLTQMDQSIERARERANALDQQIGRRFAEAGSLAQALADLLPYVGSEDCPVCGRDFSEEADQPLRAHLSNRIAALTEDAERLQALARERAEASRSLAGTERERANLAARQLSQRALNELKGRRAGLEELERSLTDVEGAATAGERLIAEWSREEARLNSLRAHSRQAKTVRAAADRFAQELGVESRSDTVDPDDALGRMEAKIRVREETLVARQSARRQALIDIRTRETLEGKRATAALSIQRKEARAVLLGAAQSRADDRIKQARELARRAREVRADIVRRVFNDALNAAWRDLFVRLAPDEPFIPRFAVPEVQGGPVEAVLETSYRSGGKSGNPRAMLSAGNLNTAALTLFLALHLSAGRTLPWLAIDDPVQSMDEVHIAQLAALLRTLSKYERRQVVIAIHEKPLFDYLALELSPAFPGDRLITIEIGRTTSGQTVMNYEPLVWRPDKAGLAA